VEKKAGCVEKNSLVGCLPGPIITSCDMEQNLPISACAILLPCPIYVIFPKLEERILHPPYIVTDFSKLQLGEIIVPYPLITIFPQFLNKMYIKDKNDTTKSGIK
jgi:hypothetical protein